ncbi:dihydroorotase [Sclerotinia borealis F-4128]|uniref:dihydroorotase n=1 Tax=Sclerotinia borealis (strain F-4128) TaxID=1432307 RepID=W9CMI8_SCLBF|nr:dihydroorotase [Sclerotinia borealis F-4128]
MNMNMSPLSKFDGLEIPAAADMHVHLRDGKMMEMVVPTIRMGGVNTVYVMPNLVPPITTVSAALAYKERLEAIDPKVEYLMTLYLHESITPDTVREAKKAGIMGIKSYPAGVTTNSSSGVLSYEPFYPVFSAMQEEGLILNLHGECPSDHQKDITILNAEASFLPTLQSIHQAFPTLKIVLEHCTTAAAIATVQKCGPSVVGTITAHHLSLTIDQWADDAFHFCKPVAKLPSDRTALLLAASSHSDKFFLGTDSAPHDIAAKKGGVGKTAAGVFTQAHAVGHVLTALEQGAEMGVLRAEDITVEILEGFLGKRGRAFYGVEEPMGEDGAKGKGKGNGESIILKRGEEIVRASFKGDGVEVVPFWRGQRIWSVLWK